MSMRSMTSQGKNSAGSGNGGVAKNTCNAAGGLEVCKWMSVRTSQRFLARPTLVASFLVHFLGQVVEVVQFKQGEK